MIKNTININQSKIQIIGELEGLQLNMLNIGMIFKNNNLKQ